MSLKKRNLFFLLFLAFWNSSESFSVQLDYYLDYARFAGNADFQFVEIYLEIPRTHFQYESIAKKYRARVQFTIEVFVHDSLALSQSWQSQDVVDSLGAIQQGQLFQEVYGMYLRPGLYRILSRVTDLVAQQKMEKTLDITVLPMDSKKLTVSDIQLASSITPDTVQTRFVKNGYRIFPNAGGIYGTPLPVVYYYAEIYNLSPLLSGTDSTYTTQVQLMDASGKIVKQEAIKSGRRIASALVELGNLYVGNLPTGPYRFQLFVVDNATKDTVLVEKPLYIYRVQDLGRYAQTDNAQDYSEDAEYFLMDEKTLDRHFEYARYIATRTEEKAYKKLNVEGKRTFFKNFWKKRDTDPSTPQNEFKEEYYNRIRLANQRFSSPSKEGWKTDRGRVLILYGHPDDTQRNPFGSGTKPYEVWIYHKVEGGVKFIFIDESGYGDYKLVHSTAINEIHDEQWESRLQ